MNTTHGLSREVSLVDEVYRHILHSVSVHNTFPITSRCGLSCIFCSNRYNPWGIKIYDIGNIDIQFVDEIVEFLDSSKKVVIGESATRINEGDPFLHPRVVDIISMIRRQCPFSQIQITTNGVYLTEVLLKKIVSLSPISLVISLNFVTGSYRNLYLSDNNNMIINNLRLIAESEIPFHGSIILLPALTGWNEVEKTVAILNDSNCLSIRLVIPGFTGLTPKNVSMYMNIGENELRENIMRLRESFGVPVYLEPSIIEDLKPVIIGIVRNSRAENYGFKRGDVIKKIDSVHPSSRVEAFHLLQKKSPCVVEIQRDTRVIKIEIKEYFREGFGIIMDYDIDMRRIDRLKSILKNTKEFLIITSVGAYRRIQKVLTNEGIDIDEEEIIPVSNITFGGNIISAGLMTIRDISEKLRNSFKAQVWDEINRGIRTLILPEEIFDFEGKDLWGDKIPDSWNVVLV